jgi:cholesterol transport system auxiliary component
MSRVLRALGALACALALGGCVSLLPKSKPVHLYRFGQTQAAGEAAPASARSVAVGSFQREASGDRLLTITGERAAYLADSRWVAPAQVLFDQAVVAAFDGGDGKVRLTSRGDPARTDYVLRLDVRTFETRYEAGAGAPPVVLVRLRALLIRDDGRSVAAEQIFESRAPASVNRVSAIVAAYDKATADVVAQLIAWTNQQAS